MRAGLLKALPRMKAGLSPSKILTPARVRRIQRSLYNIQVTLVCGFVTILVLRGTIGAGKFGTPAQDLNEIRNHITRHHERLERPFRTMMEFQEKGTERDSSKPFSFEEVVNDWDAQRSAFLSRHPGANRTFNGKPHTLLVTGSQPKACDNPVGDYYLLKTLKNKIDYCRLHNIEIFYNMAHLDSEMSGFWSKLPLLRKIMLSQPEVEWIWWMDSDAFFTDMTFELPMEKYSDYNLVLHGWDDMVYKKKSWIGLNTGSFLIRNCQWSLDLLDVWAPMGPKGKTRIEAGKLLTKTLDGRPEFEADDQSALIYLLATQKSQWSGKSYLESSYYLHGYWVILVDKYEEMMEKYHPGLGDDRWPLVTHFVGCKPCHGSSGDYTAERCIKNMERAFNFADNQILATYGYEHLELDSFQVRKSSKQEHSVSEDANKSNLLRGSKPTKHQ